MHFTDRDYEGLGASLTVEEFLAGCDEQDLLSPGDMAERGSSRVKILDAAIGKVNAARRTSSFGCRQMWIRRPDYSTVHLVRGEFESAIMLMHKARQAAIDNLRSADAVLDDLIKTAAKP